MAKRKKSTDDEMRKTKPEQTPTVEDSSAPDEASPPAAEETPPAKEEDAGAQLELEVLDISVQELQAELGSAQAQAAENLDGWQRALAEFANYKKRIEREQMGAYQRAAAEIITRFLSVVDDLELALEDRPTHKEASGWAEGIELIYRKLKGILESEGVETIVALGESFDPNLHEAVSHEESDNHAENEIIGVLQQGYLMGDRVLRPARVRVAK